MEEIRFGPAGYPEDAKGKPERAFEILKEAGLTAFEYAAVYGLRTSEEKARVLGNLAKSAGIAMSMHAAYYINLASKSDDIRQRSKMRLEKALRFAPLMGVKRIVFHVGTYGGLIPEEAHKVVRSALQEVWEAAGHLGEGAYLAPEIAGKINAYGSIEEIVKLCAESDGLIPTIDWAHMYARTQGKCNNKQSYLEILGAFEDALGSLFVSNMHFHISGIIYTQAGEKAHRPLGEEWGPDILPLIEIIKEVGYKPTFISETPTPLKGALYAKFLLAELEKHRA